MKIKLFTLEINKKWRVYLLDILSINEKSLIYFYKDSLIFEFEILFFIHKRFYND